MPASYPVPIEASSGIVCLPIPVRATAAPSGSEEVAQPRPPQRIVRRGPLVAVGGRTGATPASWKVDPTGNLTETPPALDLLQPDIAYLAKIVAAS